MVSDTSPLSEDDLDLQAQRLILHLQLMTILDDLFDGEPPRTHAQHRFASACLEEAAVLFAAGKPVSTVAARIQFMLRERRRRLATPKPAS